ncbi:heterokaryon incompatibility protein-domain-containing protein [Paraphoma chrysanthemicola]|uniref:Heterokaryon incompatibility protein-domain-containing protein n=1 Tax=Paraphoma chrysanthemicola TaxID=798071 RepID=A0A8K0R206_9PLEO|nr:heterokaryon incompatibility protein-domain-containing protein [Paraphoma chrysanthemicola]
MPWTKTNQIYPGPLLPTDNTIRMLHIKPGAFCEPIVCCLDTTSLTSPATYEALSYAWGDSTRCKSIRVSATGAHHEVDFQVTANCFDALRRLRFELEPRTVWIDAICIDQSNTKERSQQVALMSKIYSAAKQVVVYLGEGSEDSDLAIDFILDCSSLSFTKSSVLKLALWRLFQRPWFTRVWVIQEVTFAQTSTVYVGNRTLAWTAFRTFYHWNNCTYWLNKLPLVVAQTGCILERLCKAQDCLATDPRDKVFALLPLLTDYSIKFDFAPDYEISASRVFTNLAASLIPEIGLKVLELAQYPPKIEGLPSWVPDWSMPRRQTLIEESGMNMGCYKTSEYPRVIRNYLDAPDLTGAAQGGDVLQVSGQTRGRIIKLGTTYFGGRSGFPLYEWQSILLETHDPSAMQVFAGSDDAHSSPDFSSYPCGIPDLGVGGQKHPVIFARSVSEAWQYSFGTVLAMDEFPGSYRFMQTFVARKNESRQSHDQEKSSAQSSQDTLLHKQTDSGTTADAPTFGDIPFYLVATDQGSTYQRYVRQILRRCSRRRFFLTDSGYMGLGTQEMEVGDSVYKFASSHIPFVFRDMDVPQSEDIRKVNLIGACYMRFVEWCGRIEPSGDSEPRVELLIV